MRRNSTNIVVLTALAACALPGALGASAVNVAVNPAGTIRVKTPAAVFELLRSGYLAGHLIMNGQDLTLDDPAPGEVGGDVLLLDFSRAKISDIRGGIGPRGKRIEVAAKQAGGLVEKVLALEVYDDFPKAAFLTVTYRNIGKAAVKLEQIAWLQRRLNAALTDAQAPPFQMWSFQGSSFKWGHDDVSLLTKNFSRRIWLVWPRPPAWAAAFPWWRSGRARPGRPLDTWNRAPRPSRFRSKWATTAVWRLPCGSTPA
jgi:hypothetical protein